MDLNGTRAILRAGYEMTEKAAATEASKLLRKPEIVARIQTLRDEQSQRTKISADYVLENLTEIVERCMQRAPVMVRRGRQVVQLKDEEGRDVWRFDSTGANAALGMLGKHFKLFTEKHEHSGPDGKPIEFNDHEAAAKLAAILNAARERRGEG